MSRTQEASSIQSPVKERYSIDMKHGKFSMSNDDSDDFNDVKLPFHFILLDANAFRIKGKNIQKGWEIKSDLAHQKLAPFVKVTYKDKQGFSGDIASGNWSDIKDKVNEQQGRFNQVLYAAKPNGDMVTLTLRGKGYFAWLDFLKKNKDVGQKSNDPAVKFANHYFSITGLAKSKSDFGESFVPVFGLGEISKQETLDMANRLDIELQLHFGELFGNMQATPDRDDERRMDDDFTPSPEDGRVGTPVGDFPPASDEQPPVTDDLPF